MNIFNRSELPRALPADPNGAVVEEIYRAYPFGVEGIGVRGWIRMIVHVVLELKKRGLI